MLDKKIKTMAGGAREYVAQVVNPLFQQEPLLHVPTKDYEFRVKFPGKHEVQPMELVKDVADKIRPDERISIYAHIPQCRYRCNFCTYAVTIGGNADEDAQRLLKELNGLQRLLPIDKAKISSLYFGGGTPTTLTPRGIYDLVHGFIERLQITPETEVTMEGSPDTITEERVDKAKKAGVTRFSVGVQTFDERILNACNRQHTAKQAEEAIKLLAKFNFREWNVDLMRGLPYQTLESFANDLLRIIDYDPTTINVYRMRVMRKNELRSAFERDVESLGLSSIEDICAMQYVADSLLIERGYRRQHTASWSKTTSKVFEDRWQQQIPLIALGWRAYSLFQFGEWHNNGQLGTWRSHIDNSEAAIEKAWKYEPNESELRRVLFQLKTSQGFKKSDKDLTDKNCQQRLRRLEDLGIIERRGDSFIFTDRGFIIGEEAIRYLSLAH